MTRSTPRLMRAPEVRERTGLSRSGLYRAVVGGTFPSPVPLTTGQKARTVAWVEEDVDGWIRGCIEARLKRMSPSAADGDPS